MTSQVDPSKMALVLVPGQGTMFVDYVTADFDHKANLLSIVLDPGDQAGHSFLTTLASSTTKFVGISYQFTGVLGTVRAAKDRSAGTSTQWLIELESIALSDLVGPMEMGFSHWTAEDLAELRARRVLLDEKLKDIDGAPSDKLNRQMLDSFVAGWKTPMRVPSSPFPFLWREFGNRRAMFLVAARLFAVLQLRGSAAIERVTKLFLEVREPSSLFVDFEGVQHRRYANEEPRRVVVKGECRLDVATL